MLHRFLANRASAVLAFSLVWGSAGAYAQSTAVTSVAPPTTVYDRTPLGKNPEADEAEPLEQWNLLLGGNWEISKRWSLTAEVVV